MLGPPGCHLVSARGFFDPLACSFVCRADVSAEDEVPAVGAEVLGECRGWESDGSAALSARSTHSTQIQHTASAPTQFVSVLFDEAKFPSSFLQCSLSDRQFSVDASFCDIYVNEMLQ